MLAQYINALDQACLHRMQLQAMNERTSIATPSWLKNNVTLSGYCGLWSDNSVYQKGCGLSLLIRPRSIQLHGPPQFHIGGIPLTQKPCASSVPCRWHALTHGPPCLHEGGKSLTSMKPTLAALMTYLLILAYSMIRSSWRERQGTEAPLLISLVMIKNIDLCC